MIKMENSKEHSRNIKKMLKLVLLSVALLKSVSAYPMKASLKSFTDRDFF